MREYKSQGKYMYIKMTRDEALEENLLVCQCGWPPNNHYSFAPYKCVFNNSKCNGYKEKSRVGIIVDKNDV